APAGTAGPSAPRRGEAAARRRRLGVRRGRSIAVDLAVMLGEVLVVDVPAAVGAGRGLDVAVVAVERPAEQELLESGVVMDAARHVTLALAQRTDLAKLGDDGAADEGALVVQLVEQVGQFFLDLEG